MLEQHQEYTLTLEKSACLYLFALCGIMMPIINLTLQKSPEEKKEEIPLLRHMVGI
jgi:hypothetical protein